MKKKQKDCFKNFHFIIHILKNLVPFKIYVEFESLLKWIKRNNRKNSTSYTEKYQDHIPCSFVYKIVGTDDKFSKPLVLYRGKDTKVKDHDHVTEKYRGSADWSCNINLKLTKNFLLYFII